MRTAPFRAGHRSAKLPVLRKQRRAGASRNRTRAPRAKQTRAGRTEARARPRWGCRVGEEAGIDPGRVYSGGTGGALTVRTTDPSRGSILRREESRAGSRCRPAGDSTDSNRRREQPSFETPGLLDRAERLRRHRPTGRGHRPPRRPCLQGRLPPLSSQSSVPGLGRNLGGEPGPFPPASEARRTSRRGGAARSSPVTGARDDPPRGSKRSLGRSARAVASRRCGCRGRIGSTGRRPSGRPRTRGPRRVCGPVRCTRRGALPG